MDYIFGGSSEPETITSRPYTGPYVGSTYTAPSTYASPQVAYESSIRPSTYSDYSIVKPTRYSGPVEYIEPSYSSVEYIQPSYTSGAIRPVEYIEPTYTTSTVEYVQPSYTSGAIRPYEYPEPTPLVEYVVEEKPGPIGEAWEEVLKPIGFGVGAVVASPIVLVGGVVAGAGAAVGCAGYGVVSTARGFMGIVPLAKDTAVNSAEAVGATGPRQPTYVTKPIEYQPTYTYPSAYQPIEYISEPTYITEPTYVSSSPQIITAREFSTAPASSSRIKVSSPPKTGLYTEGRPYTLGAPVTIS
jgi:hypothetical protein